MKINQRVRPRAFSLIEVLVYLAVLTVVLGVGYGALYRSMDNSNELRRNTEDIARAIRAGERWRSDIRAAQGSVRSQTDGDEQLLILPNVRGVISYRFATNTVFRRWGSAPWREVLPRVKASTFNADQRPSATVWRWELEMQSASRKPKRFDPLFTFIAVPSGPSLP